MSYFNFLLNGVNGLPKQYIRDQYPNPTISYSGHVDNFHGTFIIKQDDKIKIIQIDTVFKVTTISDKVMQNSRKVWGELQISTKITFMVTLIGGLAGIATAAAISLLNPRLVIPAIAVGAFALTIFAFSFFAQKRNLEAENELKKWEDLVINDLIERCKNLNSRLKAEDNMKTIIESKINKSYQEILNLMSIGDLPQTIVKNKVQSLALEIHTIWTHHTLSLLNECGTKIPKEKIYEILDLYIEKFPLLRSVKELIVSN